MGAIFSSWLSKWYVVLGYFGFVFYPTLGMHTSQGVVTAICPVLPLVTAIKTKLKDQAHRQATTKGSRWWLGHKYDQIQSKIEHYEKIYILWIPSVSSQFLNCTLSSSTDYYYAKLYYTLLPVQNYNNNIMELCTCAHPHVLVWGCVLHAHNFTANAIQLQNYASQQ